MTTKDKLLRKVSRKNGTVQLGEMNFEKIFIYRLHIAVYFNF